METGSRKVATRPSRLIEGVVKGLIPYTLRDAVIGDFREDCESLPPRQWIRHVVRIVYRMVVNQVRTTIQFGLAGAQACALYLAFTAAAISPRALAVVAVALGILILRHAQRHPVNGSPQETALDSIIAVTFGFMSQALLARETGREVRSFSPEAESILCNYQWPGNVRQLQNVIEEAIVLGSADVLGTEDLQAEVLESAPHSYHARVYRAKREIFRSAFARARGHCEKAAAFLDLHPRSMHRLLKSLDLNDLLR